MSSPTIAPTAVPPTFVLTDANFFEEYATYYAPPPATLAGLVTSATQAIVTAMQPLESELLINEIIPQSMGVQNREEFEAFTGALNAWNFNRSAAMPALPSYVTIDIALFSQWYALTLAAQSKGQNAPSQTMFLVPYSLPPAPIIESSQPLPPPPPVSMNPIGPYMGNGYYDSTPFGALLPAGQKWPFPAAPGGYLYHYVNTIIVTFDFWYIAPPLAAS